MSCAIVCGALEPGWRAHSSPLCGNRLQDQMQAIYFARIVVQHMSIIDFCCADIMYVLDYIMLIDFITKVYIISLWRIYIYIYTQMCKIKVMKLLHIVQLNLKSQIISICSL